MAILLVMILMLDLVAGL